MSKVLPHFSFQSTVKSFSHRRLYVFVLARIKVYLVLFNQFLYTAVQEFFPLISLEMRWFTLLKQIGKGFRQSMPRLFLQ